MPKVVGSVLLLACLGCVAARAQSPQSRGVISPDGSVALPVMTVPYSDVASPGLQRNFVESMQKWEPFRGQITERPIAQFRAQLDEQIMIPGLRRLREAFAVHIRPAVIGGVRADVVEPADGISPDNRNRVLINLHGGAMMVGARHSGQMESVPIASIGRIRVVTVDYRMAPEHRFPAASEDVARVYEALLRDYRPENIGIYGCSSGASLTAQSLSWFQAHGLPRPGAIGMMGLGANTDGRFGDANYVASGLAGGAVPLRPPGNPTSGGYLQGADPADPLVNPASSDDVLRGFPPSILLSGTRDFALSKVLSTHARLVALGVEADLHVWDGAWHCSFAQGVVHPDVPEHRQAWAAITTFFDTQLGTAAR